MSDKLRAVRVGDRFGRWRVLYATKDSRGRARWLCQCDCLAIKEIAQGSLRSGVSKSCGCFNTECVSVRRRVHGESHRTKEWRAWKDMILRCYNPKNVGYKNYGGRGITVCKEWRKSYSAFLEAVGRAPSPMHTIDRTDNNRGYAPGNVQWITQREQRFNTRRNRILTFRGLSLPLTEWANQTGKPISTISYRLIRGWSVEDALTVPRMSAEESCRKGYAMRWGERKHGASGQ